MGRDKALLELNGHALIEYALEKLRALGFSPYIVGSRPDLADFAPVIPDIHPKMGPLGGIEAALTVSDSNQNLFLAVDLPFIPAAFLGWMVQRAEQTSALATIPCLKGKPQPLCAIYGKALLLQTTTALIGSDAKVIRAVERASLSTGLRVDMFDIESIAASQSWPQAIPLHRWFQNLNAPRDFDKAALEQLPRIH
jgi:molybdopterin-guanine dinucleotide biosynthesis protein A